MSQKHAGTHLAVWGMIGLSAAFGALAMVTMSIGPASIPIWMFTVGGAALIFRGPIGKAIAKRISGEADGGMPPELQGEMLQELDDLRHRVLELEERVDFSERLLAQAKPERHDA
ncbi:MAG: hypothetical protein KJZ47_03565 [Gemmatimonadales bacterium]|nr:hypothetical protein [Gemmatimonadales bacterium]